MSLRLNYLTQICSAAVLTLGLVSGCATYSLDRKPSQAPTTSSTFIKNVRVFDGENLVFRANVLIQDGKIARLGEDVPAPSGAIVIDGSGKTLLPGLIDSHTHIKEERNLIQALMAGVTTEMDLGWDPAISNRLKDSVREGRFIGADLFMAGELATAPGGHGTEFGRAVPTLTQPEQAESFVAERFSQGSDYLKIVYDDGRGYAPGMFKSISKDTLNALVKAVHARKKITTVHVQSKSEAMDVIQSGADGLAHIFGDELPDDAFKKAALKNHTWVIPTLSILNIFGNRGIGPTLQDDPSLRALISPSDAITLRQFMPLPPNTKFRYSIAAASVKQLSDIGVPILAGTDVSNPGVMYGVSLHEELQLLVEAGLKPIDALRAATSVPAKCFRLSDRGRIAPGFRADLLLVDGNPAKNIKDTRKIVEVWKAGQVVDRSAFIADVRQQQMKEEQLKSAAEPNNFDTGLVSNFDKGTISTQFGSGWDAMTDKDFGGTSQATTEVVAGGANGTPYALRIRGQVNSGSMPMAGALFSPGQAAFESANLSSKPILTFWAKAPADFRFRVSVLSVLTNNFPVTQKLSGTGNWKYYEFDLSEFDGLPPYGITGIFFGLGSPGPLDILIDEVQFKAKK